MSNWHKILGISALLLVVCLVTAIFSPQGSFLTPFNIQNVILRTSLFGIISIGVAFVIMTGGIDLSIGSVIGLVGVLLPMMLDVEYVSTDTQLTITGIEEETHTLQVAEDIARVRPRDRIARIGAEQETVRQYDIETVQPETGDIVLDSTPRRLQVGDRVRLLRLSHTSPALAIAAVLLLSIGIGLVHGLLVTKMRLQSFVVTLCGLLIYRGIARAITDDQTQGFGNVFDHGLRQLATGRMPISEDFGIPIPFLIMVALAIVAAVLLNKTIFGRYLLAVGRNEQAARYSGIPTDRTVILAYVISSFTAGVGGVLFALYLNSVQPSSHGEFYELYAIAAAVLGGCSLRGGEGTILGVIIGAALMRVLNNSIGLLGISTKLEFAIIGGVILAGVMADELVRRLAAGRRSGASAQANRTP